MATNNGQPPHRRNHGDQQENHTPNNVPLSQANESISNRNVDGDQSAKDAVSSQPTTNKVTLSLFKIIEEHLHQVSSSQLKVVLRLALEQMAKLPEQGDEPRNLTPLNIIVDINAPATEFQVEAVRLEGLEHPTESENPDAWVHPAWSSMESLLSRPAGAASDMFTFGMICIYALSGFVVLKIDIDGAWDELLDALRECMGFDSSTSGEELQALHDRFRRVDQVELKLAAMLSVRLQMFKGQAGLIAYLGPVQDTDNDKESWEGRFADVEDIVPMAAFKLQDYIGDPLARDFVRNLISLDPRARLSAENALRHPWFARP